MALWATFIPIVLDTWFLFVILGLVLYLLRVVSVIVRNTSTPPKWSAEKNNSVDACEVVDEKQREWKGGDISITKWFHSGPGRLENELENEERNTGNKYFAPINLPESNQLITILIPFYNEEYDDLLDTLESLYENTTHVEGYTFSYLLIQDGWSFASASMKENLMELFKVEEPWNECYNRAVDGGESVTYIMQRLDADGYAAPTTVKGRGYAAMPMNITLMVKKDNRKKHNSHEWFFSSVGFCGAYNPKYCFATDCSTMFAADCLKKLITKIRLEQNCVVVTGKQVVKTAKLQRQEGENWFEKWLRMVQGYDFESSFSAFMGAFAEFGFLPVVPGPCGLYRWELLKGKCLTEYFAIINKPVYECGIIENNFKIAEDRILSYFSVFCANVPAKMSMCPNAEFYFDAETDLVMFVKQRRRWNNGTAAGYIYITQNPGIVFKSELPWYKSLSIFFLFLCQLISCLLINITPSIFICCLYQAVYWAVPDEYSDFALYGVTLYTLYYLFFQFIHIKTMYLGWTFFVHIFVGSFTVILSTVGSVYYLITAGIDLAALEFDAVANCYVLREGSETECYNVQQTVAKFAIILASYLYVLAPLVLTLHSFSSFKRALTYIIPFYLFVPTLVAWYGVYCNARVCDFTWGNRPSSGEEKPSASSAPVAAVCPSCSCSQVQSAISLQEMLAKERKKDQILEQKRQQAKNLDQMQRNGIAYAILVASINIIIISVYVAIDQDAQKYLFVALMVLSVPTLILFTISTSYFIMNYMLEQLLVSPLSKILLWISGTANPNRDEYSPVTSDEIVNIAEDPACKLHTVEVVEVRSDVGAWRLLAIMLLISSLFFACNISFQFVYLTVEKVLESHNIWIQHAIIASFISCGLVGLVIGWLGDRFAPKHPNIFLYICFTGCLLSSIANITCSSVLYSLDDENILWLLYVRSILVVLGNSIAASSGMIVFFRAISSSGYLLEFTSTKVIFGALGSCVLPLIVIFYNSVTDSESPENNGLYFALSIVSSVLLLVCFIGLCVGARMASSLTQGKETAAESSSSGERMRFFAIVFIVFFGLTVCYAPIQFGLKGFLDELDDHAQLTSNVPSGIDGLTTNNLTEYIFLIHALTEASLGLLSIAFFKHSLTPISAVIVFISLFQIVFCIPFLGDLPWTCVLFLCFAGIYRTFSEIFSFYYFVTLVQGLYSKLGIFYGLFCLTIVLAQVLGYCIVGFVGIGIDDLFSTPSSLQFGLAGLFSILAFSASLKLPSLSFKILTT